MIDLRLPMRVAPLVLSALAGCATVPDSRVVPEGFAPPGTPVDVRLGWEGTGPAIFYNHTEAGYSAGMADAGIVGLLFLPFTLIADASIIASNKARAREARAIAESVTSWPDRATIERDLAEAMRTDLGWLAPRTSACDGPDQPAGCDVDSDAVPAPIPAAPATLVMTVAMVFALSLDARALLFQYDLSFCRAESVFAGKSCADDRPLEARVLIHSDSLPEARKDVETQARLTSIIEDRYGGEFQPGAEGEQQAQARDQALTRARDDTLYEDEAMMLAVDSWLRDDAARLKEAFAASLRILSHAVLSMRESPGSPVRNNMSVTRVVFPMFYDRRLPVRDLDVIRVEADGRRLLRSRLEPMRFTAITDDVANVWFSVPVPLDDMEAPEKTLIEFLYRR